MDNYYNKINPNPTAPDAEKRKEFQIMKKIAALLLAMTMVFSLAACSSSSSTDTATDTASADADTSSDSTETTGAIAVTIPTSQSVYCYDFALGVVAAAEDLGWTCTIDDPNVDINSQITAIENWVTSGVQGIVIMPVDGSGVTDATQAAIDAGLIVTAYDNDCAATYRVEEDENETGHTLAQPGIDWALENTDGAIQVAVIAPNEAEDSHNGRILTGLLEAIEEELPDAEVVSIQKSTDSSETMTLVENIIQAYPDVQLIYNQLDDTIAYEALDSLGYNNDDVCLIGAGGNDDSYKLISYDGVFRATISTDIYDIGYQCGVATIQAILGEEPDTISTSYSIVTIDNLSDFYTEEEE